MSSNIIYKFGIAENYSMLLSLLEFKNIWNHLEVIISNLWVHYLNLSIFKTGEFIYKEKAIFPRKIIVSDYCAIDF